MPIENHSKGSLIAKVSKWQHDDLTTFLPKSMIKQLSRLLYLIPHSAFESSIMRYSPRDWMLSGDCWVVLLRECMEEVDPSARKNFRIDMSLRHVASEVEVAKGGHKVIYFYMEGPDSAKNHVDVDWFPESISIQVKFLKHREDLDGVKWYLDFTVATTVIASKDIDNLVTLMPRSQARQAASTLRTQRMESWDKLRTGIKVWQWKGVRKDDFLPKSQQGLTVVNPVKSVVGNVEHDFFFGAGTKIGGIEVTFMWILTFTFLHANGTSRDGSRTYIKIPYEGAAADTHYVSIPTELTNAAILTAGWELWAAQAKVLLADKKTRILGRIWTILESNGFDPNKQVACGGTQGNQPQGIFFHPQSWCAAGIDDAIADKVRGDLDLLLGVFGKFASENRPKAQSDKKQITATDMPTFTFFLK